MDCLHSQTNRIREFDDVGLADFKTRSIIVCRDCGRRVEQLGYRCERCGDDVGSCDLAKCECGMNLCGDCRDIHGIPCAEFKDEPLLANLQNALKDIRDSRRHIVTENDHEHLSRVLSLLALISLETAAHKGDTKRRIADLAERAVVAGLPAA